MNAPKPEIWGLTGGIAAGKSTAAKIFAERGIAVLDADRLARELSAPGGAAHAEILARFGSTDRTRLRNLIFSDAQAKRDLEAILHPHIARESARFFAAHPRAIYEASLLIETGRYRELAGLIVLSAPEKIRLARLLARQPELTPGEAQAILLAQNAQFTPQSLDRVRQTQAVIEWPNDGPAKALGTRVDEFIQLYNW